MAPTRAIHFAAEKPETYIVTLTSHRRFVLIYQSFGWKVNIKYSFLSVRSLSIAHGITKSVDERCHPIKWARKLFKQAVKMSITNWLSQRMSWVICHFYLPISNRTPKLKMEHEENHSRKPQLLTQKCTISGEHTLTHRRNNTYLWCFCYEQKEIHIKWN